jgi:hypothetical protein
MNEKHVDLSDVSAAELENKKIEIEFNELKQLTENMQKNIELIKAVVDRL